MIAHRLFVGTVGEVLFHSTDHGQTFVRLCQGMFVECTVRALFVADDGNNAISKS